MKKTILFLFIFATIEMLPSCRKSDGNEYVGTFRGTYIDADGNECDYLSSYNLTLIRCDNDIVRFLFIDGNSSPQYSNLFRNGDTIEGLLDAYWFYEDYYEKPPILLAGIITHVNESFQISGEFTRALCSLTYANNREFIITGFFEIKPK